MQAYFVLLSTFAIFAGNFIIYRNMKSKVKSKPKSKPARPRSHGDPVLIRFDWAIKRLLRQKANFTVLEGFLSVLLEEDVKIVSIRESEGNREHPADKFNRVDIFVENSHGELLIIEIQNSEQVDYFLRMVYGAYKAVTEHIFKGVTTAGCARCISSTLSISSLAKAGTTCITASRNFAAYTKTTSFN